MRNEAASPLVKEQTLNVYSYETVKTLHAVIEEIQYIISTRVEQVALVIIKLHYEHGEKASSELLAQLHEGIVYFLNNLRPLVRRTDSVFLLDHGMYFVLPGANEQGGQIVQSRLWEALLWRFHNTSDRDVLRPHSISIGHSAYPAYDMSIDEFVECAKKVSLRFDAQPEKAARKAFVRHARQVQQPETDEELPALARKLGIPYLSLLPRKLPQCVQHLVNPQLAQELHCYPLGRERNMLTVAMLDPQDRSALDRLHQETGLHIFPVLIHPYTLKAALEQLV